ncbi:S22 vesicle trafficking protein [Cyanidiococcus yangmingshanensis]|uniref:S22 vesicle trafficking protein n=1 Tax=Cyanidiococcus yangmingshanensis TaxID=2690220 RepID=A0A7J7ISW3_9RHOD|nr:S22 vesicle trafficking protein [Cyanidiococcus yangmingshanensis]
MPKITFISRLADGLPLAASLADEKDAFALELREYERQAKRILKSLTAEYLASGTGNVSAVRKAASVEAGAFTFHYLIGGQVAFLTLAEKAYPRKLAFAFLDELRREFETMYGAQVESASRPYEMIRFDSFIQKSKKVYLDASATRNLEKLNSELLDVLGRGERLESLQNTSALLSAESRKYLRRAKRARWMLRVRQYGPMLGIILVIAIMLWFFKLRGKGGHAGLG